MPTFSRHDIDTMAFRAADELKQGVPLHSSITKMARDNSMNPEQIKRLVESANTAAFLNQFKEKTGSDRMVEFDVADPSKVIDDALGDRPTSGTTPTISITISVDKPAEGLHDSVENENLPQDKISNYQDKVASYEELPVVKLARDESSLQLDTHKKAQLKDSILTKLADCNYRASDLADDIALSFRGIYTRDKYAGLELDALATHGNAAIPALQLVRSRLGMDKIANKLSAQQDYFLSDRHVVQQSKELTKVSSIVELCTVHDKLSKSLSVLSSKV